MQTAAERVRQKDPPDWSIRGGMKNGASPRTGSSGGEPGATDWSVRGNGESTINRKKKVPRIGAPGAERGKALASGLDRPGVNPVPRTGVSEAAE